MDSNAAYKAWKVAKWDYYHQGVPFGLREHIGRGFRQGFKDVAGGGTGETPIFPPAYYWGPEYRNQKGSEAIAAWFRGYQDGVLAADQSGIRDYVPLPTSWAPPYATGPDGYNQSGYNPGTFPGGVVPNGAGPNGYGPNGMPGEPIPPGVNPMPTPPNLNRPPLQDPLTPRTISPPPPVTPGGDKTSEVLPGKGAEILLPEVPKVPPMPVEPGPAISPPAASTPATPSPATTTPAPGVVPKPSVPEPKIEKPPVPAGKQTFLPPGSPRRSAHADVRLTPVADVRSFNR